MIRMIAIGIPLASLLVGCLSSEQGSEPEAGYASTEGLVAETRMEFVEGLGLTDSSRMVFVGLRLLHVRTGLRYRVSTILEYTDGEWIGESASDGWAEDTVRAEDVSMRVEVAHLKGRTVRARILVNGSELARDSVTYY
jgi:hypothetical protein